MTVAAQNTSQQIAAAAGQTVFPFSWRCDAANLVSVYVDDALDGGFSVALNADQIAAPGGTITRATAALGTEVVTIERVTPQTQDTALARYGAFAASTITSALDKIVMQAQEASAAISRTFRAARSNFSKFSSLELPDPQDGSMIAFQADAAQPGKFKFQTALSASKEYVDGVIQAILGGGVLNAPTSWVAIGDDINTDYAVAGAPFASPDLYYVTINGVPQEPTTSYTMDITVVPAKIKFTEVVPINARIFVRVLGYAKGVNVGDTSLVTATGSSTARTLAARFSDYANPRDFGAKGDDAADDTPAIQAALNTGKNVYINAGTYRIIGELAVTTAGQHIRGAARGTIIRQHTQNKLVFDVQADNVVIENIRAENPGGKLWVAAGTWHGGAPNLESTAFYTYRNHLSIRHCEVDGFTAGVFFGQIDANGLSVGSPTKNSVVGLLVSNVDFGVLSSAQVDMYLDNIAGSYARQPASPNPAHLVYVSDNAFNLPHVNLVIGTLRAWDSTDPDGIGYVLQLKSVNGAHVNSVYGSNCPGVYTVLNSTDVVIDSIVSVNDISTNIGAMAVQTDGTNLRHSYPNIYIDMATNNRAVRAGGTDAHFGMIVVHANHAALPDVLEDVYVSGTREKVDSIMVRNKGAGAANAAVTIANGGNVVDEVSVVGGYYAVQFFTDPTDAIVKVDGAHVTFAAGISNSGAAAAGRVVNVQGTSRGTANIVRAARRRVVVQAGAGYQVREDAVAYAHVMVSVSDANAFTIQNPWAPSPGLSLTYEIFNNTAGAIGAIAWGADFSLASAFVNPGAGLRKSINFVFDGTLWREQWRN